MQKSFQYNHSTIFYTVVGSGKPVVLLHGFAEDCTIWNNQLELQNHCQIIIPDLPGSGKSELLKAEKIGMEDYGACIYALLNHERIESCIMLGHSMGGYITLAFAEQHPAKLRGFGFIHSTAFEDNEGKKMTRKKGIKLMEDYGVLPFIKNTTPNLFSEIFKKTHPEKINKLIDRGRSFTVAALTQYYAAMLNRADNKHVLKISNVPVLFIAGTDDVAVPLNDVLQQSHLPRVSYIHIINNAGHMSMLEAPDDLNKHLLRFIDLCESV